MGTYGEDVESERAKSIPKRDCAQGKRCESQNEHREGDLGYADEFQPWGLVDYVLICVGTHFLFFFEGVDTQKWLCK